MPKFVGFQTIIVLDPNGITLKLQGSLVWPFNFYLNLAHYTGSQILNQTGQKFLAPFCTFCLKNNDDNAMLSSVLKFTSIMDEKGWQKKDMQKNILFFGPFYNFYWIKLQKNSHHHHLRIQIFIHDFNVEHLLNAIIAQLSFQFFIVRFLSKDRSTICGPNGFLTVVGQ